MCILLLFRFLFEARFHTRDFMTPVLLRYSFRSIGADGRMMALCRYIANSFYRMIFFCRIIAETFLYWLFYVMVF